MKKLLCVLLAVVMLLSLTACSKPLSEEIVGEWVVELHINGDLLELENFDTDVTFPVLITFTDDGEVTMEAYDELEDETSEALTQAFKDYMLDILYDTLGEDGATKDEIDELIQSQTGMTSEEYVESYMEGVNLYDELAEAVESEGEYEVDDDKMIIEIDGDEIEVEIKGDTMTFVEADDEDKWEALGFEFPIELKRAD